MGRSRQYKFKETSGSKVAMFVAECSKVGNAKQSVHGVVPFLYLSLNMGVSGRLVIGFT